MTQLKFGLTLPNRGVLFGVETMADLLDMGQEADESGLFQSLWVGDSILAKRRPESVSLLITNPPRSPLPSMVLTGDCLFVGDVGRPDFGGPEAAGHQYDSNRRLLGRRSVRSR